LKYVERDAVRYADDLVVRTQGSGSPGDLAAIQRNTAGKALTQFQTFLISDWDFFTKEVLQMRNPERNIKEVVNNAAKFALTTTMFNVLFEDVMNVQSPFPTPIRDVMRGYDEGDNAVQLAWRLGGSALEPVPIIGASRYGKSIAGPIVNTLTDLTRSLADAPLSPSPFDPLSKFAGIPGSQQVAKTARAIKRGENPWQATVGWYNREGGKERREQR